MENRILESFTTGPAVTGTRRHTSRPVRGQCKSGIAGPRHPSPKRRAPAGSYSQKAAKGFWSGTSLLTEHGRSICDGILLRSWTREDVHHMRSLGFCRAAPQLSSVAKAHHGRFEPVSSREKYIVLQKPVGSISGGLKPKYDFQRFLE